MIPNPASTYPLGPKEATWKTRGRRLKTGHTVATFCFCSIFRELFTEEYKVREEKKSHDLLRADRPSKVVGSGTEHPTSSRRSVSPIQHTPGFWEGQDTEQR